MCVRACVRACMHVCMYVCMYACLYVSMHVCFCVCMCVACMYLHRVAAGAENKSCYHVRLSESNNGINVFYCPLRG